MEFESPPSPPPPPPICDIQPQTKICRRYRVYLYLTMFETKIMVPKIILYSFNSSQSHLTRPATAVTNQIQSIGLQNKTVQCIIIFLSFLNCDWLLIRESQLYWYQEFLCPVEPLYFSDEKSTLLVPSFWQVSMHAVQEFRLKMISYKRHSCRSLYGIRKPASPPTPPPPPSATFSHKPKFVEGTGFTYTLRCLRRK